MVNPWFKSHKFWVMISSVIALVGTVISGEATVGQVLYPAITLILGYMGINVIDKKTTNK